MLTFESLVPDRANLSAAVLRAHGLRSLPLPELPSTDELRRIMTYAEGKKLHAWAYYYGRAPIERSGDIDTVLHLYERETAAGILVVDGNNSGVWVRQDHDVYVAFGEAAFVDAVRADEVSGYTFEDYLAEEFHSENSRRHLEQMMASYTL